MVNSQYISILNLTTQSTCFSCLGLRRAGIFLPCLRVIQTNFWGTLETNKALKLFDHVVMVHPLFQRLHFWTRTFFQWDENLIYFLPRNSSGRFLAVRASVRLYLGSDSDKKTHFLSVFISSIQCNSWTFSAQKFCIRLNSTNCIRNVPRTENAHVKNKKIQLLRVANCVVFG